MVMDFYPFIIQLTAGKLIENLRMQFVDFFQRQIRIRENGLLEFIFRTALLLIML